MNRFRCFISFLPSSADMIFPAVSTARTARKKFTLRGMNRHAILRKTFLVLRQMSMLRIGIQLDFAGGYGRGVLRGIMQFANLRRDWEFVMPPMYSLKS